MSGFKKFILRGNVVDLAVGVVIGAAFATVVTAIVTGVLTPIIGLGGDRNFEKLGLCLKGACPPGPDGTPTGNVLLYGAVLTAIVNFLIVAAVLYFAVVKPVNALVERRKVDEVIAPTKKECPDCLSSIPLAAMRCAFCTVEQPELV